MRALLQRVNSASVSVEGREIAAIGRGLLVLVGIFRDDNETAATRLAERTLAARIFPDDAKPMNRSVVDVGGAVLAVSQFTLAADTSRGNRPGFGGRHRPRARTGSTCITWKPSARRVRTSPSASSAPTCRSHWSTTVQ